MLPANVPPSADGMSITSGPAVRVLKNTMNGSASGSGASIWLFQLTGLDQ